MYPTFIVRDGSRSWGGGGWSQNSDTGCMECCCDSISLKPGTKSKIGIAYAPWSVPIGRLHCVPQFTLDKQIACGAPGGSNLPPQITPPKVAFDTAMNVTLTGDLRSQVTDPDGDQMTFKFVPGNFGPAYGSITIDPVGMFIYVPATTFTGIDRFYASASDGINAPVVFEVVIGIGSPSSAAAATPNVIAVVGEAEVNYHQHMVTFPLQVSPAAQTCEVWKLNIYQAAIDCACAQYTRTDCFDIRIAKC